MTYSALHIQNLEAKIEMKKKEEEEEGMRSRRKGIYGHKRILSKIY